MRNIISIMNRCFMIVIISAMYANAGIITGPIVNPANGHSYYLLDTDGYKWWFQAESEAVSLGGHLVHINDAAENQWVINTFSSAAINYASAHSLPDQDKISLWIGYSDYQHEGTWVWSDGETSQYSNWYTGEPAGNNPDEDFAGILITWWTPGWHDIVGDTRYTDLPFGVVEVVPEPAALMLFGLGGLLLKRFRK